MTTINQEVWWFGAFSNQSNGGSVGMKNGTKNGVFMACKRAVEYT